jgi:hypothetical protein
VCFSATGSFAVSAVLTGIGVATLTRNSWKPLRMFAAIPLLFAAQQAAEGVVWLTMGDSAGALHRLAVNAFLSAALVVWPMWLPFSLRLVERDDGRRRALTGLFWLGVLVSVYAASLLARWQPTARIAGHSISYDYQSRHETLSHVIYLVAYVVPTLVPFFVSTLALARTMGVMLIASLAVTVLVQRDTLTSVWCFFAALMSCLILVIVGKEQRGALGLPATQPALSP